jgi:hypothetical protein
VNHQDDASQGSQQERRKGVLERHKGRAKEMAHSRRQEGGQREEGRTTGRPGEFASRLRERVAASRARRERGGDHAGM